MCILACTACTIRNAACVSSPSNAACIAPRLAKIWWASVGELNLLTVGSHSLWRECSPPPEELTSAAGSARLSALLAAGGAHPRSAALARVLGHAAGGTPLQHSRARTRGWLGAADGAWPYSFSTRPEALAPARPAVLPRTPAVFASAQLDAAGGAGLRAVAPRRAPL
jgi:hypothetical protein